MTLFKLTDEDLETAKKLFAAKNEQEESEKREVESRKLAVKNNAFIQKNQKEEKRVVKKPVGDNSEQQTSKKPDDKNAEPAPNPKNDKTNSNQNQHIYTGLNFEQVFGNNQNGIAPLDILKTLPEGYDFQSLSDQYNLKYRDNIPLDFTNIDFSKNNITGQISASIAKNFADMHIHEVGNNLVPALNKYLPQNFSSHGQAWCALEQTAVNYQTEQQIKSLTGLDIKLPKSEGALDMYRQYAEKHAITRPAKIDDIKVGDVGFNSREGNSGLGHVCTVVKIDKEKGIYYTSDGNAGKGEVKLEKHSFANLYHKKDDETFLGFGSNNLYIQNTNNAAYTKLENNINNAELTNNKSLALVTRTTGQPSHNIN